MRKKIIISLLALASLASCSKKESEEYPVYHGNAKPVTMTVSVTGSSTKATGIDPKNEEKHTSLQVLVFDSNGLIEVYKDVAGTDTETKVGVLAGTKTVYAFLNAPSLKDVSSETALLAKVSSLSDNSLDSFVMYGSTTKAVSENTTIKIDVRRLVAKVILKKITAEFSAGALGKEDFFINKIYMEDVAATANYGLTLAPTTFYSGAATTNGAVNALLFDAVTGVNLKNGGSCTTEHDFYVYPTVGAKTPSLVIEGTLMGETQVYVCKLPAITRNCTYQIDEVVITRPGGDEYILDCEVKIVPWETGLTNYTERF